MSLRPAKKSSVQEHSRRHRMLMVGRKLMLHRGYTATTVDEICEEAGVTKGSFFHHFASKEGMARVVLERFIEGLFAPMSFARDPRLQPNPLKRLQAVFDQVATAYESMEFPGCMIGLFTMELGVVNEAIRESCAKAFRVMRDGLARELSAAMDEHDLGTRRRELDPQRLAEGVVAAIQGGEILARASNDPAVLRAVLRQQFTLLEQAISGSGSPESN